MASYKVLFPNSTLGELATIVTDEDIAAAPADVELLIASGIVEPVKTKTQKEMD